MAATPYQIRQLQRAINSFNDRYHLGQPHIPVDSIYGKTTAEESRWMQWILGMPLNQIGKWKIDEVIKFLFHPSLYYTGRADQYNEHRKRLAAIRQPNYGGHNLIKYDEGIVIAAWIKPYLDHAKKAGTWQGFGITGDQFCGWRGPPGSGMQATLYKRYLAGLEPGPVAVPGRGMHEYCDCKWCQIRMHEVFGTDSSAKGGAVDARNMRNVQNGDLVWAGDGDPPHGSNRNYQRQTGRY